MASHGESQGASLDGRKGNSTPWSDGGYKIFGARTAEDFASHLFPYIKKDSRILDVGSGPGSITIGLAERTPEGSVVGIDTDQKGIDTSTTLAKEKGLSNVHFQIGDVYDLSEFPDDSFDVIHAHQVITHLAEPVKGLKEMRRVLKPQGIIAIRDTVSMHILPFDPIIEKQMSWYRDFKSKNRTEVEGGKHHHVWMHEAGFPWDSIRMDTASYDRSSPEAKKLFGQGAHNAFRSVGVKMGYGSEADFDEVNDHWKAWSENDAGRFMTLDSVVMAIK